MTLPQCFDFIFPIEDCLSVVFYISSVQLVIRHGNRMINEWVHEFARVGMSIHLPAPVIRRVF